jgi:hypothetical protein
MSTLSDGITTIEIDDGLAWADEFAWQPVAQSVKRSITGALIVTQQDMTAGQPMTLAAEADDKGWITRAQLLQCRTWASTKGLVLTLTYRGTAYSVIWRLQDGAIDARPVMPWLDDDLQDDYRATLRLMRT